MAEITAQEEQVIVEPRPGAEMPSAGADSTANAGELPEDLLRIPAFQALVSGQPGAVSINLADFEKRPEAKILAANKDGLMKAGFGLYRALDGANGVVLNALFVSPDEIKQADAAGQLASIAPPFDTVNAEIAKSGANNPVLAEGERPTGFKSGTGAPAAIPVTPSNVKPAPASVQKSLANARSKNLAPSSPTSGPKPAGGRLLASILKPVI